VASLSLVSIRSPSSAVCMTMPAACLTHVAARGRAPFLVALVSLLFPGGPQIACGHRDRTRRGNRRQANSFLPTAEHDLQHTAFLEAAVEALSRQTSNQTKSSSEQQHGPSPSSFGQWTPEVVLTQKLTSMLKFSMVRIKSSQVGVNWFKPYEDIQQGRIVGAGFAAQLNDGNTQIPKNVEQDPVFVTSAAVVSNSHKVVIQFPAVGRREFQAYMPLIFPDRDLAILKLKTPKEFLDYLKANEVSLQILPIRQHEVALGENVAAIGFPMSSATAKLSTGVIAGTEFVYSSTVFQSTAPISPGSDGGPLLALGDSLDQEDTKELRVVGVNFVAPQEAGAENVNYATPLIHIRQLFNKYQKLETTNKKQGNLLTRQPCHEHSGGHYPHMDLARHLPVAMQRVGVEARHHREKPHSSLKLGPIGALIEHANREMFWLSNCSSGPLVRRIQEESVLRFAQPPILENSFIQAVDGVAIDPFGEGRPKAGFLRDPMPLQSLMAILEDVESDVEITVCREGNVTKHNVSLTWRSEYEKGIRWVEEPMYETQALDYEVFAGITVMEMTANHVWSLIRARAFGLGKWLLPENRKKKRLMVTHVETGSWAEKVLWAGAVLESLNGQNVSTLKEFRANFVPKDQSDSWWLKTDDKDVFVASFQKSVEEQTLEYLMGKTHLGTDHFLSVTKAGRP